MSEDLSAVVLPRVMTATSTVEIHGALKALRGRSVVLDGSGVERPSTLGIQVLAAAVATWRADGCSLRIKGSSPALCRAAAILGFADEQLHFDGAAP